MLAQMSMSPGREIIMTAEEAAAYLRVHRRMIYRLLKRRELPAFKIGSDFRLRKADIDEWIREREKVREKP
jgi:excisionase family DNA binding protein